MIKVLYILGIWENGGIEKVIKNYCENLSREKYQFFILPLEMRESVFTDEIVNNNIAKIITPSINVCGNPRVKFTQRKQIILNEITRNDYDVIHMHNSIATSYLFLKEIKRIKPGIKLILHSHGNDAEAPHVFVKRMLNKIIKSLYCGVPDFNCACSEDAGKWLFSKRIYRSKKYKTLVNAFDTRLYSFDYKKRLNIRQKLNIEKNFVIGTIGRFCYQKNPEFVLDVFLQISKQHNDARFIWIGNGSDKEKIIELAIQNKLEEKILFIDKTRDVQGYLSAMDLFVLPSRYEGLGLVLVEAQASGLRCIASDTINKGTRITDRIEYLSIEDSAEWAKSISSKIKEHELNNDKKEEMKETRKYSKESFDNSDFELGHLIKDLDNIYSQLV